VHFLAPKNRGQEKEKDKGVSRQTEAIRAGHVGPPSMGVKPSQSRRLKE
jgi:hypothetical protein